MKREELITLEDLLNIEKRILSRIENLESSFKNDSSASSPEFLRTKSVKELLQVSDNKLKSMREKGEIPFSFIGSTYYYPKEEILKTLKENTIKNI